MPVVGQKNPCSKCKSPLLSHPRQRVRQSRVIPFVQFSPRWEQFHGYEDEAVLEERAGQPGHAISLCAASRGCKREPNSAGRHEKGVARTCLVGARLFSVGQGAQNV
jgi:hypothetical protein